MEKINISSSLAETEKKIENLQKKKIDLEKRKETKIAELDMKILAYQEKIEAEKLSKITPINDEIKAINASIAKLNKVKEASIKYEEQLRKMMEE